MAETYIITYVPPTLFSIVAVAFLLLWRLKVITSWHWSAGFAQTALGFVLSTFSIQPMFDAFSSGMIFIGAAYCYGSGLLSHFCGTQLRVLRRWIVALYTPPLAYFVFVEQSLVRQLFLTDAVFALLLGVAVIAVTKNASRPVDKALVGASAVVVLDSVLRTAFFTFFTDSSDNLGDFANSTYNLAVHVSTITVCMIFPFTALGAIASAAIDLHREEAETDPLTKLLNRRGFEKALERDFESEIPSGCALVFDIDHFKHVNDSYGHALGDQVIVVLATILKQQVGRSGYLARVGGEEFIALLPDISENEGERIANLVRATFEAHDWSVIGVAPVTVSGGMSHLKPGPRRVETAFLEADAALYVAKANGRNRVCRSTKQNIDDSRASSKVIPFKKINDIA